MRIGIDVSSRCSKWDGVGTYVKDMVDYLSKLECEDMFYLYSNKETAVPLPEGKSIVAYADKCDNHLKWMFTQLPKRMKADKLDAFWQPNYLMPIKVKEIKNVITVHDVSAYAYSQYSTSKITLLHKLFLKPSCRKAQYILAISKNGALEVSKHLKIKLDKIKMIYIGKKMFEHGLDVPMSRCIEYLKSVALIEKEYLLFVGTLSPRKNAKVIVDAYFQYRKKGGKRKLVIAGKIASNCEVLRQIIERSSYKDQVLLTGYISDEEKRILYYHAGAMVFPSRLEGFGFPLLEAMQAGIPVITSNVSCMPEIAGDAALYLKDIDDSNELADLFFRVEKMSREDLEKLRQLGYKRVEYFDNLNYRQLTYEFLKSI